MPEPVTMKSTVSEQRRHARELGRAATRSRRLSRVAGALPLLLLVTFLSACTFTGEGMTIEYKSDINRDIWELYSLVFWLATAVFIVVEVWLLYSLVRFRRRPGDGLPRQIHGNNRVELAWTIAPFLLLVVVAIPTVSLIVKMSKPMPNAGVHVKVIGHQFWWEAQYFTADPRSNPDLQPYVVTANEIHIPNNETAAFYVTSDDVQHSFWIAKLGGKVDVYPNRINYLWFTPFETGNYFGQCAELCGTAHAYMKLRMFVEERPDFDRWVASQRPARAEPREDLIRRGERVFTSNACVSCHAIEGTNARGVNGPNLTHYGSRTTLAAGWIPNTEENTKRWIRNPEEIKPGAQMPAFGQGVPGAGAQLSEADLDALVKYLASLK